MSEQLKLSNQLCHRFYMASNAITRAYRPVLKELDITYPQYLVMLALWETDNMEVGEIKSATQIDGGALSLIIKKLSVKGYLFVGPSDEDKRIKIVSLSETGRELKDKAESIPGSLLSQFPQMNLEEFKQLKELMDKLLSGVEAE